MLPYTRQPDQWLESNGLPIASFEGKPEDNLDAKTVDSFGHEWAKFDHFSEEEIRKAGDQYFDIIERHHWGPHTVALDVGCGAGRWSYYLAQHVGQVEAVDPSSAVHSARHLVGDLPNVRITQAGVDTLPFADESVDFLLCLGVLHHIPNTAQAMQTITRKLKPGGVALFYLYYKLDNRSGFSKLLFRLVDFVRRRLVAPLPTRAKLVAADILAVLVYLPLIGLAKLVKALSPGRELYRSIPLSYYVGKSWNIIRNDALDRFGTPLEQRFTREEIHQMMRQAGLSDIVFSPGEPYWHARGIKQPTP